MVARKIVPRYLYILCGLCYYSDMGDTTENKNDLIEIKSEVNRLDDTVNFQKEFLDKTEKFFGRELEHVLEKTRILFKQLEKAEKRLDDLMNADHECYSKDRIEDNKDEIMEANRSIRRLYIWQAGIGISLLVCFLTLGVAALTFVNRINFEVEKSSESISKIESQLEKQNEEEREDLKKAIKEALKEQHN